MLATLAVPLIVTAVTVAVFNLAPFALAWYIVRTTGKTEGLPHLAELMRVIFRSKP